MWPQSLIDSTPGAVCNGCGCHYPWVWGVLISSLPPSLLLLKLIAECEQVKTEREMELISEQVLIAMSEMGLDRERTIQVGRRVFRLRRAVLKGSGPTSSLGLNRSSFCSPYKQTSTITTAPSTVCWRTASRNTRLCLSSCRRRGPSATPLTPCRYGVSVGNAEEIVGDLDTGNPGLTFLCVRVPSRRTHRAILLA